MDQYYNKHYIRTDAEGRITDAWSDGPHPEIPTTEAICINDKGGYQLRLIVDGKATAENTPIWTEDGIPLYKWDGETALSRTEEEIEADRAAIPPAPPSEQERLRADVDFILAMEGWA